MRFETLHVTHEQMGFLELELRNLNVPVTYFEALDNNRVAFNIDDNATQTQIDDAQGLADNMQSLTVNILDELDQPINSIPDDGETKMVVTCDELPTEFGYAITTNFYDDVIVDDSVDTDGILEIVSNEMGLHYLKIYDLSNSLRVNYHEFKVVNG